MPKKIPKKIQAAGALFLSKSTKRYLFLLRDDDSHTNTWGLVGGRVETDEQIVDCLHREIKEEIGNPPNIIKIIPLDLYTSQDEKFEYHTFACIVDDEFVPKLNHEHKGFCWCGLDNIPKPIHPALYNSMQMQELRNKINSLVQIIYQLN